MSHHDGLRPIHDVTDELGLDTSDVTVWGDGKAKVLLDALDRSPPNGRLILVSAMTPTPAGEGKTTTAIGLAQGFAKVGTHACAVLREPSLGPTFRLEGGATGGGRAVVEPSDDSNFHFTGDFHAVTSAHNLLAALLDNHVHRRDRLGLDVRRVLWRRVLDMNDRSLRHTVIGMGGVSGETDPDDNTNVRDPAAADPGLSGRRCHPHPTAETRVRGCRRLTPATYGANNLVCCKQVKALVPSRLWMHPPRSTPMAARRSSGAHRPSVLPYLMLACSMLRSV